MKIIKFTSKIIKFISDCEFTMTGGFAIYGILCVAYVTATGIIIFINFILR